jgi:hypothetical protein
VLILHDVEPRLHEIPEAQQVPLHVDGGEAQEDHLRLIASAHLLQVEQHLIVAVSVDAEVERLGAGQHRLEVGHVGLIVAHLVTEG